MFEYVIFSLLISIKLLLIGTDHSTDFEVHRNWKSITNTLPIDKWYFEDKSEWTLDYPPMFAYMEFILGFISKFFDTRITQLLNLNYNSLSCVIYQRLSVLIGDLILFFALKKLSYSLKLSKINSNFLILLIQGFAGLILVDNMHFQYNTLLFGLFFYSLSLIFNQKYITGAIVFSILLNMKHIFIYVAPAYFVFYLKYYVFSNKSIKISNFFLLAFSIITVFLISFSPFIYYSIRDQNIEQFSQILKRLFPFKRGLLHSYWAPNFWALYSFADKILYTLFTKFSKNDNYLNLKKTNLSSLGMNQDINFDVLPNITIKFANILIITLTFCFIIKSLIIDKYEKDIKKQISVFINYLIISSLIFFNFGFQVHEKAYISISLLSIIQYINQANENSDLTSTLSKKYLLIMIMVGVFAQMPLIHTLKDYLIKFLLVIAYLMILKMFIKEEEKKDIKSRIISFAINYYIFICITLDFIVVIFPHLDMKQLLGENYMNNNFFIFVSTMKEKYQFLPLMLFSVINSIVLQLIIVISLIFKNEEKVSNTKLNLKLEKIN